MSKLTQHEKRIGMMEVLYEYFLEQQTHSEFKTYLFEEEGKRLIAEQCQLLEQLIDKEEILIAEIEKHLIGTWTFNSLKPIEKAILILATYEIMYCKIDKNIVIDEAIIIAKAYSPNQAYKFINGVLDKIKK